MKVILLKDDKSLGKKGDIITVSDGFAFNNLIPRGIAKTATAQVLKEAQRQNERAIQDLEAEKSRLRTLASSLDKKKVTILAQAKGDRLFGSVTTKEIVRHIQQQYGSAVTEKMIILQAPIKTVTTQEISIDFGYGIIARVILTVGAK